jgi:major vault protein
MSPPHRHPRAVKVADKAVTKAASPNDSENVLARPFRRLWYQLAPARVVLDQEQYCHLLDIKTGKTTLIKGPVKRNLNYDERLIQTKSQIVVPEKHFCIIKNPYIDGVVHYGLRQVRVGPITFALHPGEEIEQRVTKEYVLTRYDGLLIKVLEDFSSSAGVNQVEHHAGDEFLVIGPKTYIPSKHEQVLRVIKAISLSDTDGIYVQNKDTGDVSTIKGPADYFLKPNEKRWRKELTDDELSGVGLKTQDSSRVRVLTRQAANTSFLSDPSNALVLELEEKEVVQLYDGSESRIELGPQTVFVGPYERPKVLTLSGGKPIRPNVLKVGLLKLGPDFIYDRIKVRTKDNAQIVVDVTYKWRFTGHELKDAFSIDDFVGYAAETLSSDIRSVVAKHNFEDLHANSLQYAKDAIFGKDKSSRIFEENGLEIFGIDITSIVPEDPKIAEKLHEAIKHNMDVYCRKIVLQATLEAERQEIEGKKKIEAERGDLIDAQAANYRKEVTERAHSDAAKDKIRAESRAGNARIEGAAERECEKQRLDAVLESLSVKSAPIYLELEKAHVFKNTEKLVIVPSKSKLVLPFGETDSQS